ncbi:MAG: hypothetical protein ACOYOB_15510 [Myxococcota bacterium]
MDALSQRLVVLLAACLSLASCTTASPSTGGYVSVEGDSLNGNDSEVSADGSDTSTQAVCGDGTCDAGETSASCLQDCPKAGPVCGDGTCDAGETSASCLQDCPKAGPVCGDGTCDAGESTATCATDCPAVACKATYSSVQTILKNKCNGCHGHKFGTSCNYAKNSAGGIKSMVKSGSMPPGGFANAADKQTLLKWISDGALCTMTGCP